MEVGGSQKKRGKSGMVSHLHRNSGTFPRVIVVELPLFQHGSTAGHKYIGTKHHTMRRKLMKFVNYALLCVLYQN